MPDQTLRLLLSLVCSNDNLILVYYQEGPHSVMNEEEFFDALEIAYHDDEMLTVSRSNNPWLCLM